MSVLSNPIFRVATRHAIIHPAPAAARRETDSEGVRPAVISRIPFAALDYPCLGDLFSPRFRPNGASILPCVAFAGF
jgi:hypothetical protein